MSDKQQAIYLQRLYDNLFEELETIKAELETDTKYNKPYKSFAGHYVQYFPLLERLSSMIEKISDDIETLKGE